MTIDQVLGDRRWTVLTGAGVSTDSGIPDYRGPDSVPRTPMTGSEFRSGPRARQRYWARAYLGWTAMRGAARTPPTGCWPSSRRTVGSTR